jgi:hypothetical protein
MQMLLVRHGHGLTTMAGLLPLQAGLAAARR